MKKTRGLSLILCIAMLFSIYNFSAHSEETEITAYITISMYGDIVTDKNGEYVAEAPVTLTGKESYNLDDLFREAHELYYDGGAEAGYATQIYHSQEYGDSLSVAKVWGDTSGKFGYQMNLGEVSVWGPDQAVNNGDYVDLCVYENYYPATESYAKFDAYKKTLNDNTEELTLYESYYGENWETLFKPCENATIYVNGEKAEIVTDANGKCTLSFYENGIYLISAKKSRILKNSITQEDETVSAITAPICILNVAIPEELLILHNAVKKLTSGDLSAEEQMYWLVADIAGYKELYPNTKSLISDTQRQKCVDTIIAAADATDAANVLAKSIIALRSMGYDAKNVYNNTVTNVDIAGKLLALIDEASASVTNIYTLPYVIIAIREYATEEQMTTLVNAAISQKSDWQDTMWGIDAIPPMMLALSPYYDTNNDVKTALLEAADLIKAEQNGSGAINNEWGPAESTGLAIMGLSAIGIDPETVQTDGNSLIDGLVTLKNSNSDGFVSSSFATEQGLRGLIAWKMSKAGKIIYDFSTYPKNTVYATRISVGHSSSVTKKKDAESEENEKIRVTVKVMAHNGDECDNSYTYKNNSSKYKSLLSKTVELEKGKTVYDATVKVLDENNVDYEDRNGYIAQIGDFSEFDHGDNSGWMFLVNGKHQNSGCKEIQLSESATITWFYTDDYTKESGSENYKKPSTEQNKSDGSEIEENIQDTKAHIFSNDTFADVKESDWHYSAVKFVYENKLMSGTDKGFEPDSKMTRAMLVSVLYRLSGAEKTETDIKFSDVKDGEWYADGILWAASVGIVRGVGDNNFAPDSEITREQMAVILYNFAMLNSQENNEISNEQIAEFEDFAEVSDYAKKAMSWANAEGFISGESASTLNPKNSATRAQIASLLMRYCEAVNK
jgi:hypothetical protein